MMYTGKTLLQPLMLLLLLGSSKGYADSNFEGQAAAVLLQRYETVVSARSRVLSQLHFDSSHQEFGRRYLGLPFVYLMGGLKAVGRGTLAALERSSEVVLMGAKDFEPPAGLGVASLRACYIAALTPRSASAFGAEFGNVKVMAIEGRPVWTWAIPPSEGHRENTTFYAAIVGNSFILSNNEDDFRDVAGAISQNTRPGGAPNVHDLTFLRTHAYWAYRGIPPGGGGEKPRLGLARLPPSAAGLELFTQFDDDWLFFNVLLTDPSNDSPEGPPSSDSLRFFRAPGGVWQAAISLKGGDTATAHQTTAALFETLYYFGYVVAL